MRYHAKRLFLASPSLPLSAIWPCSPPLALRNASFSTAGRRPSAAESYITELPEQQQQHCNLVELECTRYFGISITGHASAN